MYISGICENKKCKLVRINCMPDHMHIAVWLSADITIAKFMQEVKRGSSYWISENKDLFPKFDGWAKGYFCSTFSLRDISKVKAYIANQQKHHLSASLYDEMKRFFEDAGMADKLQYFLAD